MTVATASGSAAAEFDSYSNSYGEALHSGLKVSGESQEFFAKGRIDQVALRLGRLGFRPGRILDFGCGQGASTPMLRDVLGAASATGVDVSAELLRAPAEENSDPRIAYSTIEDLPPREAFDLAYVNGVFHHILPRDRPGAIDYVFRSLCPGGLFALWENNPWNPGTRIVMKRIPFDRDAQMLSIGSASKLARDAGFEIMAVDSLFFFPRALRALRRFEQALSATRLGAQYLVLCRKPGSPA